MKKLLITGGARLSGTVRIHGAKTACCRFWRHAVCALRRVCYITARTLKTFGRRSRFWRASAARLRREGSTLCIDASGLSRSRVEKRLAGKMRSSILLLGALLARCRKSELALPGGCPLGERPIDLHVKSARKARRKVSL